MRFPIHAMRLRRVFTFAAGLWVVVPLVSCGGDAKGPEVPEAPAPKPRNAAEIARSIAGAKVGVLVYAERARNHPVGAKAAALNVWQPVLEGTGIDPQRDLDRAYVAAPSLRSGDRVVAVAQHSLPPERVEAAVEAMIGKSTPPGEWITDAKVPSARVTVKGQTRVVAIVEPSFLVILPEANARDAARFMGTGGFADPEGPEAAVLTAVDPAETLRAPHAPRVPKTIKSATAKVTLREDGGADVASSGQSVSPEQAKEDAEALTQSVDDATSLKVSILKIRLFGPVKFTSEGDRVKSEVKLSPDDVDKLFGLLSLALPK
ncbi:MAG: hypothetical protein HUU21_32845 [Polyangiaceae bacterium]|nr:hypothetical protein [Polyangiaceae bacterium]